MYLMVRSTTAYLILPSFLPALPRSVNEFDIRSHVDIGSGRIKNR